MTNKQSSNWLFLSSENGAEIPVACHDAVGKPVATFIMLPALGIRGTFYRKLASGLASKGISTVIVEQRGHGESPNRPSRNDKFTIQDYLFEDIRAVVTWCNQKLPETPLYIGGHSLGGHMASIAAGAFPDKFAGVVHMACGFPYHGDYKKPASGFVKLVAALIPPLTAIMGYYPGNWFKFGGREYRGLMMDWRHWALKGKYAVPGIENADQQISVFPGRAISIAFDYDSLASSASIERSRKALASTTMTRLKLTEKEQGDFLGHVEWGKRPDGVVRALSEWFSADQSDASAFNTSAA
ncbi:MAG: alpha/beta fold hydrolase [Kordiimonadaceae bacterium]|nr:alpha/beta fold hydrolase [Kordiimonadaceae bacterium]MBO6569964.1 alpha/beta fold hydrolase [Kordiimonadaceae bacterium]MBO6965939.1 alpha/beta fold hydrolase [Kordiimonadaceae bacterium]